MKGADTDDITAVNVTDGDSITMKCIVDSNPKASITWYKEDMEVQRTISDRTVTLTLSNITPSDAGRYRCSANNKHGAAHRTAEIIYQSTQIQFSPVVAAALGGVLFLVLLIVMGAFLIRKMRKKRQRINKDLKNNVVPPEEATQENLQSSQGDNLVYMNHGDVQYASVEFSKVKPKEVITENMETEYCQIRKTHHN
ncbi:sialic acid-binding Ig-like lectin 8 [Bufo gargarizans]|uniref:sialic acid-binding Ig-like lectin 8 n=1 Tax=Bufo gargarizans TaxID=30331 RepID=UPI001CF5D5B5|nr:sialic acid-binding Ig-like lectin 8 [Bufo gargarizans]